MTTIAYNAKDPRFPDVNKSHAVNDWTALKNALGASPLLGFKVGNGYLSDPLSDSAFPRHYQGCKDHGIVGLGYWFGPKNPDGFLKAFPPADGFLPCLDFEDHTDPNTGKVVETAKVADAEAFILKMESEWGRLPWFYGHSVWIARGQPTGTEVARCAYWGATYGSGLSVPQGVGVPTAFQFTNGVIGFPGSPRTFPGVGSCDISTLLEPFGSLIPVPGGDDVALSGEEYDALAFTWGENRRWKLGADKKNRPTSYKAGDGKDRLSSAQAGWDAADKLIAKLGISA